MLLYNQGLANKSLRTIRNARIGDGSLFFMSGDVPNISDLNGWKMADLRQNCVFAWNVASTFQTVAQTESEDIELVKMCDKYPFLANGEVVDRQENLLAAKRIFYTQKVVKNSGDWMRYEDADTLWGRENAELWKAKNQYPMDRSGGYIFPYYTIAGDQWSVIVDFGKKVELTEILTSAHPYAFGHTLYARCAVEIPTDFEQLDDKFDESQVEVGQTVRLRDRDNLPPLIKEFIRTRVTQAAPCPDQIIKKISASDDGWELQAFEDCFVWTSTNPNAADLPHLTHFGTKVDELILTGEARKGSRYWEIYTAYAATGFTTWRLRVEYLNFRVKPEYIPQTSESRDVTWAVFVPSNVGYGTTSSHYYHFTEAYVSGDAPMMLFDVGNMDDPKGEGIILNFNKNITEDNYRNVGMLECKFKLGWMDVSTT